MNLNSRISTLIMRGLSAAEATAQAELEQRIETYRNLPEPAPIRPSQKMSWDETNALAEDFGDYSHYFG